MKFDSFGSGDQPRSKKQKALKSIKIQVMRFGHGKYYSRRSLGKACEFEINFYYFLYFSGSVLALQDSPLPSKQ